MNLRWAVLVSICLATLSTASQPAKRHYDTHNYYALEHRETSDGASLDDVARTLGVEVVERAGELPDTWLVRVTKPMLALRDGDLEASDPVLSAFKNLRVKARSPMLARSEEGLDAKKLASSIKFLELQTPRQLERRAPVPPPTKTTSEAIKKKFGIQDPLFTDQWHLVNDEHPEHSLNVTSVWDMGITGKGVITSFLDDGLDFNAPDLKDAFVPELSYDFNAHVPLPAPTGARDHHGTRCAGQVAARRNDACGVGIAYEAKAAAARILGGRISVVDEAAALNLGFQNVSIYSCSWGPRDDGRTMDAPKYLVRKAVVNGINHGRGGKGSVFVFASGNGGRHGDQCNFDGYTNSIYSVTVGAVDYKGLHPSYSEACAANMIVAYSSGSGKHIITTDRWKTCSNHHGGTSAAAPNVVGIFALALQVRPDLTWRDIQHLCVNYARHINPNDPDWEKTASGRLFSYKYGYGVIDGYAFVTAAKDWKLVKPQAWLHVKPVQFNGGRIEKIAKKTYKYFGGIDIGPSGVNHSITITKEMLNEHNMEELEHIDVRVWINHSKRGDVEVDIVSPNGFRSRLASRRKRDNSKKGFPGWRFMSLKHWGENPVGEWTIKVKDQNDPAHKGEFLGWSLALWGSAIDPQKVTKFVEPVKDYALPQVDDPDRPVVDDPDLTATTQLAKPTDYLPSDHGHAPGDNTTPAFSDQEASDWIGHMANVFRTQKWFFAALGAVTVVGLGGLMYLWRRKIARQKQLASYTALAADDIQMDTVNQRRPVPEGGPRSTRARYDSYAEDNPSTDMLPREANLQPPTGRALGFHSGFLDDDEPSAGLTPKYRDEPDENQSDDAVIVHRTPEGSPHDSRSGSREHLT